MSQSPSNYEAVIGLEVHVQLRTASKMFTRVAAGYGQPENTLTDPVVLALPGALPVMNKEALDKTIKAGLILDCTIAPVCKWDRKNYFYPDSPKNYQISQYDQPICVGGSVEIELPGPSRNVMGEHKKIPLTRIHLEEDVGKLNHGASDSLVDYNRAGTPLMEIVSEPAIHSADEAFAFLTALRTAMVQGGISDCDMEKGQLRCDANISIRPAGETKLGTKVELKNLNSISFVRDGIAHEIRRQIAVVTSGGAIVQETRDYDGQTGASQSLRSKEMAHDYRYFPDPDLMPVKVDEAWQAAIRATLPEPMFDRQRRYMDQFQLPYTLTSVLVPQLALGAFFEEAAQLSGKPQAAANWIANDLLRELAAAGVDLAGSKVRPTHIAGLVKLVESGIISSNSAKEVFVEMFATGDQADAIVGRKGLQQSTDTGELERWVADAIAADPKAAAGFRGGNEKALNAIKGAVMKASKGKANPQLVDAIARKQLEA
ncbi:Asp-tRNA(Asn)/Glu-tRNA(Gln) amidotransferase subunit GatB [Opitutus sp. GAS368]|uniref:Asp-tRNA(Asn)/Glu-tRNA(Gln) amidotransferase subunit GatB n=1 Tax=Opitutus sp. GAS368 TaxID=1882749 RepID=UPI00087BAF67|nr:Asp-tRNA(Asn)/Glu-tRNA(Gln) amidotransferase subunit GatB [Opitutus sp. GAS368]SDS34435.1 aspartyl/glutamyl-tRNA(Asn/Gln) amidotransferase subunit B [Opitutus sp. GAS368]